MAPISFRRFDYERIVFLPWPQGPFLLDPEVAHGMSIAALRSGFMPTCHVPHDPRLQQTVAGLVFPNPLGMAAGYDKNAEVPGPLLKLGFGFTEIGTVTPRAQAGNPKPRIFRLVENEAVINRLGFNNEGHAAALSRLIAAGLRGIVGVNIGANKDSEDRISDYVKGIETFSAVASYFTANISSPNTPGLRDLQARDSLAALLSAVLAQRDREAQKLSRHIPVFPEDCARSDGGGARRHRRRGSVAQAGWSDYFQHDAVSRGLEAGQQQ